jgi:DNA-binding CsgD family transcriptional regulator
MVAAVVAALDPEARGPQMALILISGPQAESQIPERAVEQRLGLAPAEARFVGALIAGQTMADYAETTGVTVNTLKTQLRHIFLKTGHNRQADLIRAVLADPLVKLASKANG